ncbi:hybrid sensor histidine kinase/response regulator [Oligoflexaceae bacterium]|nr:hybrid sensor histidine kinase/response regulator [Oligoflexaceae bacterium]
MNSASSKTRSIYDILNVSVISIIIFSLVLSIGLFAIWLFWMNAEQENLTNSLVQQKVASYTGDIVTASSLNPEGIEQQLSLILKEFPLECFHLETSEGDLVGSRPCGGGQDRKTLLLESGGLRVGTLVYRIRVNITAESYVFIITNILIFFMATSAIWLVLLKNIKTNIVNPLNDIANSIDLQSEDDFDGVEVKEIATLRKRIIDHTGKLKDHVKYQAIAQTSQMLAHDVRKPFTMLKSILEVLKDAPVSEIKTLLNKYSPEVDHAIRDVNGLIADIVDLDSSQNLELVAKDPRALIEKTLSDIVHYKVASDIKSYQGIDFSFSWLTGRQVQVNPEKINRILSNLILNAVQATKGDGQVKFKTEDMAEFVKISIVNSGSPVPEESRKHLFEAFFTQNKVNGTGLGLAIARKIVNEHGGKIWHETTEQGETKFSFTLPSAARSETARPSTLNAGDRDQAEADRKVADAARSDLAFLKEKKSAFDGPKIKLLVCDDQKIYLETIGHHVKRDGLLQRSIDLYLSESSGDCMGIIERENIDVCILDVDLGAGLSGFELAEAIKERSPQTFICIHSNRVGSEYVNETFSRGGDLFLPKPMHSRMLRNIVIAAEISKTSHRAMVLVDDSLLALGSWLTHFSDKSIMTMQSPEEFWLLFGSNSSLSLSRIINVTTDLNFGELSEEDGISFAKKLRDRGYNGSLFVGSDADLSSSVLDEVSAIKVSKVAAEARQTMIPVEL